VLVRAEVGLVMVVMEAMVRVKGQIQRQEIEQKRQRWADGF